MIPLCVVISAIIMLQFDNKEEQVVIRNDSDYYQQLKEAEQQTSEIMEKLFREDQLTDSDMEQVIKAEKMFHPLVQYAPEGFAAYLPLGVIYHSLGHLDAAEQHLRRCIQYAPPFSKDQAILETSAEAHYQLSRVLNDRQKYDLAAAESSTAIQSNPNNVNYYIGRSISFSQMKSPDLARADLRSALRLDPSNSRALGLLKLLDRGSKKGP